jgi:hypothetical protein
MQTKLQIFKLLIAYFLLFSGIICYAGDIKISGTIKDVQGNSEREKTSLPVIENGLLGISDTP